MFQPALGKGWNTTSGGTYVSLHDERLELVADAFVAHSKLKDKGATELAAHVLYALDHIPARLRHSGKQSLQDQMGRSMSDKSPRQSSSKKSEKSIKEKRAIKKTKKAASDAEMGNGQR